MKTTQIIKDYLSFSRGEQRGIALLVLILLLVNALRFFIPDGEQLNPVDFAAFSSEIDRFEKSLLQAGTTSRNRPPGQSALNPFSPLMARDSSTWNKRASEPSFSLELNSADTLDLQRLRGIGPSFARRITGYRTKLGGFMAVDQLLEVYGMDSSRYLAIQKYLTVDSSAIRKMNLNTITFKELIAHPYMPYELAKEIAVYRKKHKGIGKMEEIIGMKGVDSLAFEKLRPYLGVN